MTIYEAKARPRTPEDTRDAAEEAIGLVEAVATIFAHGEDTGELDSKSCTGGAAVAQALLHLLCRILADMNAAVALRPADGASGAAARPAVPLAGLPPHPIEAEVHRIIGLLRVLLDALRTGECSGGGLDIDSTRGAIEIVNHALETSARLFCEAVELRTSVPAGGAP